MAQSPVDYFSILVSCSRLRMALTIRCLVLFLAVLLGGCGGIHVEVRQPVQASLRGYSTFLFSARSEVDTEAVEDLSEALVTLHEELLRRVREETQFSSCGSVKKIDFLMDERGPPGSLVVQAVIRSAQNYRSEMTTAVWVTDGATGQDLGMFVVEGRSRSLNTTADETAEEIADVIIEAYNQ